IFYACNTNVDNNVGVVDKVVAYASTTMPNCPSLVPSSSSDDLIEGKCPQILSKDTLYFRKHGGFDCVVLMDTVLPPLGHGRYNEECKPTIADFSFIKKDVPISVLNDFCENNYCHEIYGNIISVENDYCKDNYCYEKAAWITVRDDSCENNYCYEFPGVLYTSTDGPITKIECSWYNVAHTSKESLLVSVDKNETGKERSIYVPLQTSFECGSTGFTIIQLAE
ncbi:MAG: hypothetical protein LBQ76_07235, partial [Candidatus Fibromonas sp.]|nr:hypothetical protein [Candidatus Fibromonas sp.]